MPLSFVIIFKVLDILNYHERYMCACWECNIYVPPEPVPSVVILDSSGVMLVVVRSETIENDNNTL